jgi:predicted glycosyltransferase
MQQLCRPGDMGNFVELEKKYGLVYSFRDPAGAMRKAVELARQADLKEKWAAKRQRLLTDKQDITGFMVDFLENWPGALNNTARRAT